MSDGGDLLNLKMGIKGHGVWWIVEEVKKKKKKKGIIREGLKWNILESSMVLIIIGANCDVLPKAHGLQQNLNPSVMGKFCNVINDVIQLFLRKRKVRWRKKG